MRKLKLFLASLLCLLAVNLLWVNSASAAYAYVGSGQFHNGSGASGSVTYSPTVGNTLLVAVLANTATPTVSDGSNTYALLGSSTILSSSYLSLYEAHVTTGGSLTIAAAGTTTYGIYVAEYSGLATSAYVASTFKSGTYPGSGTIGANVLVTTSNANVTSVPALLWGFSADLNAFSNSDPGPSAGTSPINFTSTSHNPGWLGTGSQQTALAEDTRITTTGTNGVTFGTTGSGGGNQYDGFITISAAFAEAGGGGGGSNNQSLSLMGVSRTYWPKTRATDPN
jgi:hypothetical protein